MVKQVGSKTKTKKKRVTRISPARLTKGTALSKSHGKAQKALVKAIDKEGVVVTKLIKAEAALKDAKSKYDKVIKSTKGLKTATAKKRLTAAKSALAKAKKGVSSLKPKARVATKAVKEAAALTLAEKKREESRAEAVVKFLAKWDKDYDRKMNQRTNTKRRVKRKKVVTESVPENDAVSHVDSADHKEEPEKPKFVENTP